MCGGRRPPIHCTGAPPRSVLSILHPASSAQEQRESGQAVDGQVQEVVGHVEQEGEEEEEEEEEVMQVGMGKCEAEERNCRLLLPVCGEAAASAAQPAKCDWGGAVRQSYGDGARHH